MSLPISSPCGATKTRARARVPRDEDQAGRERMVLLSDALWRGRFNGDRTIIVAIFASTVVLHFVGVMPREFPVSKRARISVGAARAGAVRAHARGHGQLQCHCAAQCWRDTDQCGASHRRRSPDESRAATGGGSDVGMTVDPMLDDMVRDIRPILMLLLGAVLLFLVIACVNLANLFGARASARRGEYAVRLALGASRARLTAQAVAESAPVLIVGGVVGVVRPGWPSRVFLATFPRDFRASEHD